MMGVNDEDGDAMRALQSYAVLIELVVATPVLAAEFPLASCKGWNGTLVTRMGTNSRTAAIEGILTQADVQEYCERDPGGETIAYGGKLTIDQCVSKYLKTNGKDKFRSTANCEDGALSFYPSRGKARRVEFPLPQDSDTSCASGMPPLIEQFKLLCPKAAQALKLMDSE